MTRIALGAALVVALLGGVVLLSLPRRAEPAGPASFELTWPVARGAFHVHSARSDGTGTLDQIAAAAAAAGLDFVIVTDHGDGTRAPEMPAYRLGVLVIDGVEISTRYGHYVAVGVTQAPYPLAGHPRAVIEDVRRLGGVGFVAHPGSPKTALQWSDWEAPFDGIEWLNADSEWRDEFWGSLGRVLLTYAFRPTETLASLLDRPESVLAQWDRLTHIRRVPALAGADAHARLGWRQGSDPYEDYVVARVPSYEASFNAFRTHVILSRPLSGDAAADAAAILEGVREGRMFTSADGIAALGRFEAKAISGGAVARPGEYLELQGTAAIAATVDGPPGTTISVMRDGERLYESGDNVLRLDLGATPGVYRLEARLPPHLRTSDVPWVLANPFYVGMRARHDAAAAADVGVLPTTNASAIHPALWRAEASEHSTSRPAATTMLGVPAVEWRFSIMPGARRDQYTAIATAVDRMASFARLRLQVISDLPRRVWVQLRISRTPAGERWGTTFYADQTRSIVDLPLAAFQPVGPVSTERIPLDQVDTLLIVVDTLNSRPGASGVIHLLEASLVP
jgi:hypothetical protein